MTGEAALLRSLFSSTLPKDAVALPGKRQLAVIVRNCKRTRKAISKSVLEFHSWAILLQEQRKILIDSGQHSGIVDKHIQTYIVESHKLIRATDNWKKFISIRQLRKWLNDARGSAVMAFWEIDTGNGTADEQACNFLSVSALEVLRRATQYLTNTSWELVELYNWMILQRALNGDHKSGFNTRDIKALDEYCSLCRAVQIGQQTMEAAVKRGVFSLQRPKEEYLLKIGFVYHKCGILIKGSTANGSLKPPEFPGENFLEVKNFYERGGTWATRETTVGRVVRKTTKTSFGVLDEDDGPDDPVYCPAETIRMRKFQAGTYDPRNDVDIMTKEFPHREKDHSVLPKHTDNQDQMRIPSPSPYLPRPSPQVVESEMAIISKSMQSDNREQLPPSSPSPLLTATSSSFTGTETKLIVAVDRPDVGKVSKVDKNSMRMVQKSIPPAVSKAPTVMSQEIDTNYGQVSKSTDTNDSNLSTAEPIRLPNEATNPSDTYVYMTLEWYMPRGDLKYAPTILGIFGSAEHACYAARSRVSQINEYHRKRGWGDVEVRERNNEDGFRIHVNWQNTHISVDKQLLRLTPRDVASFPAPLLMESR